MLDRAGFSLTQTQINTFILDKGYTNYITLQQAIAELTDNELIVREQTANRTIIHLTKEGRETIHYFENRISDAIKRDIVQFFKENKMELRDEVSIQSNYYKSTSGEYDVVLSARDKNVELISLKLSVPTEDMAEDVSANWQKQNQEIYKKITKMLF